MSFSSEIKDMLCGVNIKNKCCRASLIMGMIFSSSDFENGIYKFASDSENAVRLFSHMVRSVFSSEIKYEEYEKLSRQGKEVLSYRAIFDNNLSEAFLKRFTSSDPHEIFACAACASHFIRGVFLSNGTVTDPASSYHLEFSLSDDNKSSLAESILFDEGFEVKRTVRRGVPALYVKKSETVEDILTYIGASAYSIRIMETKILREIRNNENRKSNCDAANIFKSTGAAAAIIKQINRLVEDGKIDGLGDQLKTTARLRIDNPEMSLSELARLHEPPITKSGLFHRFEKITAYYETCYKEEQ